MNATYETPMPMQEPYSIYEPVKPQNEKIDGNTPQGNRQKWTSIVGLSILIVSFGLLIAILVIVSINNGLCNLKSASHGGQSDCSYSDSGNCLKSCLELKYHGETKDGIYTVKQGTDTFQVYCDMETDEGGWTLVASVHENDIKRKCSVGDLWSDYVQPGNNFSFGGESNWENEAVFGDVQRCTAFDYKNTAYYSLQSSDVMIWHVPSGVASDTMKENVKVSYRTTNNFLRTHGGNLKYMYKSYYPLMWDRDKSDQRTAAIIKTLSQSAKAIKDAVDDWHEYKNIDSSKIYDDLLYNEFGNLMIFGTSSDLIYLTYQQEARFQRERIVVTTTKSVPFILASFVPNVNRATDLFYIKTNSYFHKNKTFERSQGVVRTGDYKLQYHTFQTLSMDKATPCEFFFTVMSSNWDSVEPSSVSVESSWHGNLYAQKFIVSGKPSNIVMGYILLAKKSGNMTDQNAYNVSKVILDALIPLKMNRSADLLDDVLSVPIVYEKGVNDDILDMVPPVHRSSVVPGYIQFLAFNYEGYPNAFCPGVKTMTQFPEYVCIGGLSNNISEHRTCGDLAGWSGVSGDNISPTVSSGSAHSQRDISSTFLIFYR